MEKLTKEQKELQRDLINKALSELNLRKKEKEINLLRVEKHLELGVPKMESEGLLKKNEDLLTEGFKLKDGTFEEIPELEKIKIGVEVELIKKEIEIDLPTLKAESGRNAIKKELKQMEKEIKSALELLKKFRE